MKTAVNETDFQDLNLIKRGKVRDIYDLGENLLMVATDRISASHEMMTRLIVVHANQMPSRPAGWNSNPFFFSRLHAVMSCDGWTVGKSLRFLLR